MSVKNLDAARWNRACVGSGGALWALIALAWALGLVKLDALDVLLLLAFFVITPLAIALVLSPLDRRLWGDHEWLIAVSQPFAALAGGASLLLPVGPGAGAAAVLWLMFTVLVALAGAVRLFHVCSVSLADACLALALIYLPIGGVWLVLARLGSRPLGFSPTIVALTVVHFHFIPLAALVVTGLTGRAIHASHSGWPRTAYRVAAVGMLIDPLLVAAGHVLTRTAGFRLLEAATSTLLALSLAIIALLGLRFIAPATPPPLARGLLTVSGASVFLTMALACAYAVGAATGAWTITIPQMIAAHGWVNALVFGLCGLLGWRLRLDGDARK